MPVKKNQPNPMKPANRTFLLWLFVILSVWAIIQLMNQPHVSAEKITFSDFMEAVAAGQIESLEVQEDDYRGKFKPEFKNGVNFETVGPLESDAVFKKLEESGAKVEYVKKKE